VSEATMGQRIARAKQSIQASGVPFLMPTAEEQPARVRSVLRVLYLIFNEGYARSTGPELQGPELSREAIRLARMLHRLLPDDGEAAGLLALMLLVDARGPARTDRDGELIPLADQDRTLWDEKLIAEGIAVLDASIGKGTGEYQLQAAIAAVHDRAREADETDWPQILALYGLLEQLTGNPVVRLNRAVAAAMAESPSAGLELLQGVDEQLSGHYRLDAVRAHLLEMDGDLEAAREHYRAAAERATNLVERRYLTTRAALLAAALARGSGSARPT
jgi:predicted RNA polymerase sigma factor